MSEPSDPVLRDGREAEREDKYRLVIDRIEGDFAVVEVEGGPILDWPLWLLPPGAREGDVVAACVASGADTHRIEMSIDRAETDRARSEAGAILERLRERDPGGDIQL